MSCSGVDIRSPANHDLSLSSVQRASRASSLRATTPPYSHRFMVSTLEIGAYDKCTFWPPYRPGLHVTPRPRLRRTDTPQYIKSSSEATCTKIGSAGWCEPARLDVPDRKQLWLTFFLSNIPRSQRAECVRHRPPCQRQDPVGQCRKDYNNRS